MKIFPVVLGIALSSGLIGCASRPVLLAPVGPNPNRYATEATTGKLQVFSQLEGESEGDTPPWYQHTDYFVYNQGGGREVKRVENSVGHYAEAPPEVVLPAGNYIVKAMAANYVWVKVPVVIEPGRLTRVHLDSDWKAPSDAPKTEIVSIPGGYAVGWSSGATENPPAR